MLEVHLLGTFRLVASERVLPAFPTRSSKLLFSYLALHRHEAHTREKLSALLAGDSPDRLALKKLRQELWRVRSTLAAGLGNTDLIHAQQNWIGMVGSAEVSIDTEEFETRLRTAEGCAPDDERQVILLEAAYRLYTGPLLEGEYDGWCLIEQDRYRAMHHEAAERLVLHYARRRDWHRALRCARDVLRYDPFVEHVHRQVMALLCLAGDRPGALQQYSECRRILDRELSIEPMEATNDLERAVRAEKRATLLAALGLSTDAEGSRETLRRSTPGPASVGQRTPRTSRISPGA